MKTYSDCHPDYRDFSQLLEEWEADPEKALALEKARVWVREKFYGDTPSSQSTH